MKRENLFSRGLSRRRPHIMVSNHWLSNDKLCRPFNGEVMCPLRRIHSSPPSRLSPNDPERGKAPSLSICLNKQISRNEFYDIFIRIFASLCRLANYLLEAWRDREQSNHHLSRATTSDSPIPGILKIKIVCLSIYSPFTDIFRSLCAARF